MGTHRKSGRRQPAAVAVILLAFTAAGTAVLLQGCTPAAVAGDAAQVRVVPGHHGQAPGLAKADVKVPRLPHSHKPGPSPSPSSSSPSPSPSSSSPSPSPSSSSPSPSPSSSSSQAWAWCATGTAFHSFSDGFDLYNNEWNTAASPHADTMCGNSGPDWQVMSEQQAGNTAVLTYPAVQKNYSADLPISSLNTLSSTYAENMNPASGTDAEAAYDVWTTNNADEIMFWVDNHGQTPAGSPQGTVTLGGLTWTLWAGGTTFSFVLDHNAQAGSADILAGLRYLQAHGYIPAAAALHQADFGFEICSTGGQSEVFKVSGYTLSQA